MNSPTKYLEERGLRAERHFTDQSVRIFRGDTEIGRYYTFDVTEGGLRDRVEPEEVLERFIKPIVENVVQ